MCRESEGRRKKKHDNSKKENGLKKEPGSEKRNKKKYEVRGKRPIENKIDPKSDRISSSTAGSNQRPWITEIKFAGVAERLSRDPWNDHENISFSPGGGD